MMKAFKQTMSLPRLARVQRMMMRKGMIFRSQWQLLDLGGGLLAICFNLNTSVNELSTNDKL